MIKKFRTRFILITMSLVGIVSLLAFASLGVMHYNDLKGEVDISLSHAVEVGPFGQNQLPELGGSRRGDVRPWGERKSVSKIPVYSVTVMADDSSGIIANASSTAYMDDQVSREAVQAALDSGRDQGTLAQYDLYYMVRPTASGYAIAFASTDTVVNGVGSRALELLGYWVAFMIAMFAITLFLSRYVTRPVERAWEEQQRFIADASHELKTPLTIIMADATILADNPDKTVGEQSAWVEGISAEADRMRQLTEDLLTLAQADAGIDRTQIMSELDLSSIVEAQTLQFDAVAFERGLEIISNVEEGLVIEGDALRVENVVKTLLENACKYSSKGGHIDVKLSREKNQAILSVHNESEPIPEEDLEHLFDRFYRSDKARANDGETSSFGLGLSIAKSTVELHGGSIGVTSGDDGTTFTVRFNLAK